MKKSIIALFIAIAATVFADPEKDAISPTFDLNFSPYAGAENLLSIQRGFERLEDRFLPSVSLTMEDLKNPAESAVLSPGGVLSRFARTYLFWLPESLSAAITQHEVFGHGYRIRDLGSKYGQVTGYEMLVIGGSTEFESTSKLTTSQQLTIAIAGVEATTIWPIRHE